MTAAGVLVADCTSLYYPGKKFRFRMLNCDSSLGLDKLLKLTVKLRLLDWTMKESVFMKELWMLRT